MYKSVMHCANSYQIIQSYIYQILQRKHIKTQPSRRWQMIVSLHICDVHDNLQNTMPSAHPPTPTLT